MQAKSDDELLKEIKNELEWEPFLLGNEVIVRVEQCIVYLTGTVSSYWKKRNAERAAVRVTGIKKIVNEVAVVVPAMDKKSDEELKSFLHFIFRGIATLKDENIIVNSTNGCINLSGAVEWDVQKQTAERIAELLLGANSVVNSIEVVQGKLKTEVEKQIQAAFYRHAAFDLKKISVESEGSRVCLTGEVRSNAEKRDAENAAWATPGVREVISYLIIEEELTVL